MSIQDRKKKKSKSDSSFIGRKKVLEDFAIEWGKTTDRNPRFITNLYGIGGIGKSRLIDQLYLKFGRNDLVCKLNADFHNFRNSLTFIKEVVRNTRHGSKPIEFPETNKLITRFDKIVDGVAKSSGENPSLISQTLLKGFQIAGEVAGGTETGKAIHKIAETAFDHLQALWRESKAQEDRKLLDFPQREITAKLVQEINKLCKSTSKFVLMIDTFEKVGHDIDDWLLREFLGEPVTPIDIDVRIIIAGREPITKRNRHWHDEWGKLLHTFHITSFTKDETAAFLENKKGQNRDDQEIVELIHKSTKGFPLWLNFWAESNLNPEEFFSADHLQQIEERFFEKFTDEEHKAWLRAAAFFSRFNQDLLGIVLGESAKKAFDWLTKQSSLIYSEGRLWKLHDITRKIILSKLYNSSPTELSKQASKILDYYRNQLNSPWEEWKDLKYQIKIADEDLQYTLPSISYYLALSNAGITNDHIDLMLRVTDKDIVASHNILNEALQALDDIGIQVPEYVTAIKRLIHLLTTEGKKEEIDGLKKKMLNYDISSYQKAILLNLFGLGYGYSAKYDEDAHKCVEESLGLEPDYETALRNFGHVNARRNSEKAIEALERILVHNPSHGSAYFWKGFCLSVLEKDQDAIDTFRKAIELGTKLGASYNNIGNHLWNLGRHEEALENYQKAIEKEPDWAAGLFSWGEALRELKRYEEAIEKFKNTIDKDPLWVTPYYDWGRCLEKLDRQEEAIEKYEKFLEGDPTYRPSGLKSSAIDYYRWWQCIKKTGRYDAALEKLQKAIQIDQKDTNPHFYMGSCLRELGRYEDALEKFQKVLEMKPEDKLGHVNLALCLQNLKRYDEAIETFQNTLEIDPEFKAAYHWYGVCLEAMERYNEAIEQFRKETELDPEDSSAYFRWAYCLQMANFDEEAIQKYQKVLELNPDDDVTYNNCGWSLKKLGRINEAIEIFQKAIEKNPKSTQTFSILGHAFAELNRYEEAIENWQKAAEIEPDNASLWGNIGWHYYAHIKNYHKAVNASQKALELDSKAISIRCNLAIALLHDDQYEKAKGEYQRVIHLISAGDYSETEYGADKKKLLQERALVDLYDAQKEASGKLLKQINEIIILLEQESEKF